MEGILLLLPSLSMDISTCIQQEMYNIVQLIEYSDSPKSHPVIRTIRIAHLYSDVITLWSLAQPHLYICTHARMSSCFLARASKMNVSSFPTRIRLLGYLPRVLFRLDLQYYPPGPFAPLHFESCSIQQLWDNGYVLRSLFSGPEPLCGGNGAKCTHDL